MDDPNQLTGSFGAATGGSAALKAAMSRRGIDTSVLDQMSPGSVAGASPVPTGVEGSPNVGQTPQVGVTAPTKEPDTDMKIALKALAGVVKNEGELKKTVIQMRSGGLV